MQEGPNAWPSADQSGASAFASAQLALKQLRSQTFCQAPRPLTGLRMCLKPLRMFVAGGRIPFHLSLPTPPASHTLGIGSANFQCKCDYDNQ